METGGRRRERATWGPVSRGAGSKACWRHVWRARGKEGVYSPRPAARRGRRSIGAPWLRRSGAPRKQHASQRGGPTLTLGARYASALRFSFKAACRLRTGWALPPPSGTTAAGPRASLALYLHWDRDSQRARFGSSRCAAADQRRTAGEVYVLVRTRRRAWLLIMTTDAPA